MRSSFGKRIARFSRIYARISSRGDAQERARDFDVLVPLSICCPLQFVDAVSSACYLVRLPFVRSRRVLDTPFLMLLQKEETDTAHQHARVQARSPLRSRPLVDFGIAPVQMVASKMETLGGLFPLVREEESCSV